MRRQIIVIFAILFCFASAPVWAEAPATASETQRTTGQIPNRGALFKVQRAGHTLYLFGTIHVGAPDFYPLEARVSAALARSSALALEVDPHGDPAATEQALRRHGLYATGGPAANEIAPAFKPRLEHLLRRYGIAPQSVAPMKPWLLASVLAVGEFSAQGYQASLAVDSYLSRQARERKIPVVELESVGAQMALFGGMPLRDQLRFLEESIEGIDDQQQARQARDMAEAWRNADSAALGALARELATDGSFSGRFMQKVLLEGRNPPLADGIARLLARERNSMAAIGVLHLVGARSVPALLRQRGLKVERVY
jgi:uncharacterized protein YbaP (TraB family)